MLRLDLYSDLFIAGRRPSAPALFVNPPGPLSSHWPRLLSQTFVGSLKYSFKHNRTFRRKWSELTR